MSSISWATYEVSAPVPDDADSVAFGVFLAGPGPGRAGLAGLALV